MLRNVLEDYLSSVKERDFDYPLTSLLFAMGFYDIHLTDGGSEFGKDFVAKRIEEGISYQYSIQSKRGDINQTRFRDKVLGQLLEATVFKKLSHPQLDPTLPQRTILVTTGELIDNAFIELRALNDKLEEMKCERVEFWGKERLIEFSERYGLAGIHQITAQGVSGFAQFYLTYSKALAGTLSDREIEEYSRHWLDETLHYKKQILRAAIESDVIATRLVLDERLYEALIVYLALARVILQILNEKEDDSVLEIYQELVTEKITHAAKVFLSRFKSDWEEAQKNLIRLCFARSSLPMLNYLVWCARVLETASLYFFLATEKAEKEKTISFLTEFVEKEEGCAHIPGDRYAVSLVWPALALIRADRVNNAIELVKRALNWLCDRFEEQLGIARYEADEYEETVKLLGHPFDFVRVEKDRSSFLATILCDLAAISGDKQFYADVYNDLEACEIAYTYWQFPDTKAIFNIDTEEVVSYPNFTHQDFITRFEDYNYSEHIRHEPVSFEITKKTGVHALILISILLKDRYFPKMWKTILLES